MRILTRYIARRLVLFYFGIITVMVVFFIFVDFMENVEMVTKYHAPLTLVATYYACLLPKVVTELSWVSFLVAILFVLGSLARNNEFTAALAGGISLYRIGVPVMSMGVILSIGVFLVQEYVLPATFHRASVIKESDFARDAQGSTLRDVAGIGRRNKFYFFDEADVDQGILRGVHVHTMKDGKIVERIDAQLAVWDEPSKRWYLKNGTVMTFDSNGLVTEKTSFENERAPFKTSPRTLKMYSTDTGELGFRQLRQQIKNLERSGYNARRLKVDLHTKFAFPAANLIVVFLALPFALDCQRGGLTLGFALSLATALLYYGIFQISMALGKGGSLPAAVSAWLANFLFLGVGARLTMKART